MHKRKYAYISIGAVVIVILLPLMLAPLARKHNMEKAASSMVLAMLFYSNSYGEWPHNVRYLNEEGVGDVLEKIINDNFHYICPNRDADSSTIVLRQKLGSMKVYADSHIEY